jgi:hypothetical protein
MGVLASAQEATPKTSSSTAAATRRNRCMSMLRLLSGSNLCLDSLYTAYTD